MRTTRPQIEGAFRTVKATAVRAGVPDAETWSLDYAPCYGGWCITSHGDSRSLGEAVMSANRMTAGPFYQALRILLDVFEQIERGGHRQ